MPPEPIDGQVGQTSAGSATVLPVPTPDSVSPAITSPPPIVVAPQSKPVSETVVEHEERIHQLRDSDFKKVKERAAAKALEEERAALNQRAKELGFSNIDSLLKSLANPVIPNDDDHEKEAEEMAIKKTTVKKPMKRQSVDTSVTADSRYKRRLEQSEKARKESVRKWRAAEKRRRDAQRQLAAKEAEMELREVAIQSGIRDVDYSIRLLTRHLHGKSEAELAEFDEKAFFSGLREERPYLFGESVLPANTGSTLANGGEEPAAPGPDQSHKIEAESKQFDARKASPEEIAARYKELGLRQPLV